MSTVTVQNESVTFALEIGVRSRSYTTTGTDADDGY
jgi:hypothetical protein